MADDVGIRISLPGQDTSSAKGTNLAFNTQNPFAKLDTQNKAAYQTINLLITNDPPEPNGTTVIYSYTQLYKFAHGYTYTPQFESLYWINSPGAGLANYQVFALDICVISAHTASDQAALIVVCDATYCYVVCQKFLDSSGGGLPNSLSGTTLQLTTHIFVDGIA